jgi:hypothetical protein
MRSPSRARSGSRAAPGLALFALALIGLGAGCPDNHVGRPCEIGTSPVGGSSGQISTVSSPALECPSHICLLAGQTDPRSPAQMAAGVSGTGALCTAPCESNEDCEDGERANPNDPGDKRCRGGFACLWPTTVGSFACQKLCVCSDFVSGPPDSSRKPPSCH